MSHSASITENDNVPPVNDHCAIDDNETNIHSDSFVLSVWIEETAQEAKRARWRGRITHVSSGDYHYLHNLHEAVSFVAAHLEKLGVTLNLWAKARCWLASRGYGFRE